MDIAVITGASSGLGAAFVKKVVLRYPRLDEIWVIARREERLKALAYQFPRHQFRILALDLSQTSSFNQLDAVLREYSPNIKVLINDAGFDQTGLFRAMATDAIDGMIGLNVRGMTRISRSCLPYMHQSSYQIIVGSVGAYVPLPWRAVYGASKTYGRFFARALRQEERPRGVNVLFMGTGAMNTEMYRESMVTKKRTHFLNLDHITTVALKRAERGAGVYSPGWATKAVRVFGKLAPSAFAVKFTSVERMVKPQS